MAEPKDPGAPSEPPPSHESAAPPRPGPRPLDIPILKHLRSKRVILASASPRRKALLSQVYPYSPTPAHRQQRS